MAVEDAAPPAATSQESGETPVAEQEVVEVKGYVDTLLRFITAGAKGYEIKWTQNDDVAEIEDFKAFRNSFKSRLQTMSGWKIGRPYKVDPLPERMSLAYADFLFNEDPIFTAADEADQELLAFILKENKITGKLRVAADTCVSEREVWWRIYSDPRQILAPIIEWTSRVNVIPYILGHRILAVAFVNDLGQVEADGPKYFHLELHEDGQVVNKLYRASAGSAATTDRDAADPPEELGQEVQLSEHPVTEEYVDVWTHSLPILAGRVTNEDWMKSIYDGVRDLLLDLNEAHTIDSENFRLAGKKRALMNRKYQDQAGDADAGEEIYWIEDDFSEMDGDSGPFKILEYTYDAKSSIERKDDLANTILTRVGLARQLIDANASEGLAQTGTALRTRLLPTVASIKGKAQQWKEALPRILTRLQQVDALQEGQFGYGRPWKNPTTSPGVVLSSALPIDATEEAERHSTLTTSKLESIENAIAELRPAWSTERRMLEVRRILANAAGYALDDQGNPITADGTGNVQAIGGEESGSTSGGGQPGGTPEKTGPPKPSTSTTQPPVAPVNG